MWARSGTGTVKRGDARETDHEQVEIVVEGAPGALALGQGAPGGRGAGHAGSVAKASERATGIRAGLRDAGPLALAGFAANGANVVVTVLVARLLDTRGYGALAQLTSLFLIASMPGTAVVVGVVRRVTALTWARRADPVRDWARRTHRMALTSVVVLAVVAFATRGPLARALSIPAPLGVFAILTAGFVWVLLSLDRGLLQAKRGYRTLSVNLLVEGGTRTAAVLVLVAAGFGVTGAACGILVAELLTALHARLAADRLWSDSRQLRSAPSGSFPARRGHLLVSAGHHDVNEAVSAGDHDVSGADAYCSGGGRADALQPDGFHSEGPSDRRRLLLDLGASLVAMALLAYLQNVDIIVLGREAPRASGPYAAISVASKALVFGAIALGGYLLPEAAIEWHRGGHALRQLGVTLLVLAVPGTALLFGALLFPRRLLSLVFSARYLGAQSAFWLLALAMVFLSATVILTVYLLAAGQRWIGGLLLLGAVVATVVVAAAHGSPRPTAEAELVVQAGLALATAVAFATVHTRRLMPASVERAAA